MKRQVPDSWSMVSQAHLYPQKKISAEVCARSLLMCKCVNDWRVQTWDQDQICAKWSTWSFLGT